MRHLRIAALAPLLALCLPALAGPKIELRPSLGGALVQGAWQPITVTVTHPPVDGADAMPIDGEVRLSLTDPRTRRDLGTLAHTLSLPGRPGASTRVTLDAYVPENATPIASVTLIQGHGSRESMLAQKTFEGIPLRPGVGQQLRMLAIGATRTLPEDLRLNSYQHLGDGASLEMRYLATVALSPDDLPETTLGYQSAAFVYVGESVRSEQLSRRQIDALRGFVAGGGALIYDHAPSLPGLQPADSSLQTRGSGPYGRGMIFLIAGENSLETFFQSILDHTFPSPGAGERTLQGALEPADTGFTSTGSQYQPLADTFFGSVLRGPGLAPPPFTHIALLLGFYLLCVVPLQYILLKRLDRREWAWFTTPALAVAFAGIAYLVGQQSKSRACYTNVAALAEMGANAGEANVTAAIGLYSPERTRYQMAIDAPDAVLFAPETAPTGRREFGTLLVRQGERAATTIEVPQWAMRIVGARLTKTYGKGIHADLRRQDGRLVGTIRNDTERLLDGVQIRFEVNWAALGTLAPGESRQINLPCNSGDHSMGSQFAFPESYDATEASIASSLHASIQPNEAYREAIVTAWLRDPIVPVSITRERDQVESPQSVSLTALIVHTPIF